MIQANFNIVIKAVAKIGEEAERNPTEEEVLKLKKEFIEDIKRDFLKWYGINVETIGLDLDLKID